MVKLQKGQMVLDTNFVELFGAFLFISMRVGVYVRVKGGIQS